MDRVWQLPQPVVGQVELLEFAQESYLRRQRIELVVAQIQNLQMMQ